MEIYQLMKVSQKGVVTKVERPFEIIKEEQLYDWQKDIINIISTKPNRRTINWYWEPNGNAGKSTFCKYLYVKHNCLVITGGTFADIMDVVLKTDMDTVKCIIIDVFRCNSKKIGYSAINYIKDGMITHTKLKTGVKIFNPPHVIIFSNVAPDENKLSADRWNIVNIAS